MYNWFEPNLSIFGVLRSAFKQPTAKVYKAFSVGRCMAGLLYAVVLAGASLAHAGPSTICPTPQTMTVVSGGQATIDLSDCSIFGLVGLSVPPLHGSVPNVKSPAEGGGPGPVTYVNNGDGALSDTFTVLDETSDEVVFNVTITAPTSPITVTPASLSNPAIGVSYSQTLSATGGVPPYTYSLASGDLPTGLNLLGNTISGTPTASGSFTLGVQVTDSSTPTALTYTKTYGMVITHASLVMSPAIAPNGAIAQPYSHQLSTTGGTAPYPYVNESGTFPPGLSLSSSGLISGEPTSTGTFNSSVRVDDNTGGGGPYAAALPVAITVTAVPTPTVTSIAPASGPAAGGTSVTISGTGFGGAAAVTFGATPATGFTVTSATQITATAPAGTGTVDVRVTTGGGTSATSAADQFTYVAAPTVTGIAPTSGPAAGGTSVTISGTGFGGAAAVTFGATPATGFTVHNATQITATVPAGTGTVDVRVTTVGGTSASTPAGQFTYIAAPTVTGIAPTSGPAGGGTSVTISGTGFGGATAVTFGGTSAAGYVLTSATQITATAPAGTGTVDVRVTTVGGTSATSAADQFTYVSMNANLSALALGSGTLDPSFAAGTTSYAATVPNAVDSITVTPTVADAGATVKVNGNTAASGAAFGPVALNVGSNTITVEVTAQDGTTTKTYTLAATRAPLQSVASTAAPGTPGAGMVLDIANSGATCTLTSWNFSDPAAAPAPLPTGYTYPYAGVDFTARQCAEKSALTVTLTFPNPVPDNAVLMKYDATATPQWQPFVPAISGNQVTYTIVDGGLHDGDKLENGEFVDPVLLAVPLAAPGGAVGIPALGPLGLALLSLLAALAGALGLARGRPKMG